MNEVFWSSWEQKVKELKKHEPKCTCGKNGKPRSNPNNSYHYLFCPFMNYWDFHFTKHWNAVSIRKLLQTTLGAFLK